MIGGRRPLQGRKPADRRVRVDRPHSPYFRYTGPGQLVAKAAANRRRPPAVARSARIRKVAIGRPLASEEEIGERLSKKKALAIFSSDAISSSRLRDRGDPAGPRRSPARRRSGLLGRGLDRDRGPARVVVASRTARSAGPTPTGGGAYVGRRRTWRRSSGWSRRPRCSSTT